MKIGTHASRCGSVGREHCSRFAAEATEQLAPKAWVPAFAGVPGCGKTQSPICVGAVLSFLRSKKQKHRTYVAQILVRWTDSYGSTEFSHSLARRDPCLVAS